MPNEDPVNDPLFLTIDDFPLDQTEQLVLGVAKGEVTKEQVTTFIRDLIVAS